MYKRVQTDQKGRHFRICPGEGETKLDALVHFFLRLSTEAIATVNTADLTEKGEPYYEIVLPEDGERVAENTVFLQGLCVGYEITDGCYRYNSNPVREIEVYDDWNVSELDFGRVKQKLLQFIDLSQRFYVDYTAASREGRTVRRLTGRFYSLAGATYLNIRVTEGAEEIELGEQLALEKERRDIISSLFEDWVYEYNIADGKITTISGNNRHFSRLAGSSAEPQNYLRIEDLHPDDKLAFLECCRGIGSERGHAYAEARVRLGTGYHWISLMTKVLTDADGNAISVIGRLSDIDQKKREELLLKEKARKDSLTGLLNREAFEQDVEQLLNSSAPNPGDLYAMLIIDIDSFKQINDHHGHLFGDTVIMAMTETIRELAKPGAVLGRFGGDEFTIFVHGFSDTAELLAWAEQFRAAFSADCETVDEECRITCSVGIAIYGQDGETHQELLMNADKALYYVKERGKDAVAICTLEMKKEFTDSDALQPVPIPESRPVSEEITEFALELLEGSKEPRSAIRVLIGKIAKRFSLSGVAVREENDAGELMLTCLWFDEKKYADKDFVRFSRGDWRQMKNQLTEKQVIEINDVNRMSQENRFYELYRENGVRSLLQCALSGEGETFGCISFLDTAQGRIWGEEERHSLNVISKIIGNYLARERAYQKIEQKVNLMKSYDEVTGLLKYDRFKEVAQTILLSGQKWVKYAIVSTDIAHFKYFNEEYGFRNGDEVLHDFADLVVKHNSRAVAACRDYADNFIVMVTVASREAIINNIKTYQKTFSLNQSDKYMDSNLELYSGVYLVEETQTDIIQAIDNANIARKQLKEKGTSGVLVFEPTMKVSRLKEVALLHMIEEAIEDCEFVPYLQPKVSLLNGELIGAEALARWEKPSGFVAMPDEFIPVLEKSGKIVELDFFMIDCILRLLRSWKQRGYPVIPISVNLSRHHIKNPHLVEHLQRRLQQYGIDNSLLEIEITESAFVEDQASLIRTMREIKNQGFRVSIDDFGKGYSSLSMLTELPADIVKIDKDFLRNSGSDSTKGMLNNVIHLIKDNRMETVCEGIETIDQARFLSEAGCDIGQGYYFARPMKVKEFEQRYLAKEPKKE